MFSLVLNGESFSVPMEPLVMNCRLFLTNPTLLIKPYEVQSRVLAASFRVFLGAIGGSEATITNDNVSDLGQLCSEFEFSEFAQKVDDWRSALGAFDADGRGELRVLKVVIADHQLWHE
jgi:hypothetical protein